MNFINAELFRLIVIVICVMCVQARGTEPTVVQGAHELKGTHDQSRVERDKAQARLPEERARYADETNRLLQDWDERIANLNNFAKDSKAETIKHIKQDLTDLHWQTRKDVQELAQLKDREWLNVKARIEARLKKMEHEYNSLLAE